MPSNMPQGDLDVRDDPFATSRERARPPRQTILGDEFVELSRPAASPPGAHSLNAVAPPATLERALAIAECAALVDAEAAILARGGITNDASVQALEQAADKIRGLK